jgi:multidrug efflux pump subunit AcrA (membrane-fusion protein)
VSLQLKVPVAKYAGTLSTLSTVLGRQTSLTQRAQDVTQQVADVSSLVSSAQAAITQLQALLKQAGSISALLTVQQQIATQESSLEALQAQQRALARETSYATVSMTLLSPHPVHAKKKARKTTRRRGFVAGFAAGWRGLRLIGSGILTTLGAALPFAVLGAMLAGAGYAGRRHLRRLLRWPRRGTRPTAAG